MTRWQRRFHALVWPLLAGLIVVIVVAGLSARPSQPHASYNTGGRSAP